MVPDEIELMQRLESLIDERERLIACRVSTEAVDREIAEIRAQIEGNSTDV